MLIAKACRLSVVKTEELLLRKEKIFRTAQNTLLILTSVRLNWATNRVPRGLTRNLKGFVNQDLWEDKGLKTTANSVVSIKVAALKR